MYVETTILIITIISIFVVGFLMGFIWGLIDAKNIFKKERDN